MDRKAKAFHGLIYLWGFNMSGDLWTSIKNSINEIRDSVVELATDLQKTNSVPGKGDGRATSNSTAFADGTKPSDSLKEITGEEDFSTGVFLRGNSGPWKNPQDIQIGEMVHAKVLIGGELTQLSYCIVHGKNPWGATMVIDQDGKIYAALFENITQINYAEQNSILEIPLAQNMMRLEKGTYFPVTDFSIAGGSTEAMILPFSKGDEFTGYNESGEIISGKFTGRIYRGADGELFTHLKGPIRVGDRTRQTNRKVMLRSLLSQDTSPKLNASAQTHARL